MFYLRIVAAFVMFLTFLALPSSGAANNVYGAHTMIQDIMSPQMIDTHLTWVRTMTGPGGYVKQIIYPIQPGTQVNPSWQQFVQACYDRDLIPVLRLALWGVDGVWQKPPTDSDGSYTTMANTIKNIVAALPKSNTYPMYIEVLNEPNNNLEWSGNANPIEYGKFLVQVSNAIRSLGDSRIKILNAGLSPGGSYNNVAFIEQMCANVPGFIDSFDVWATHPYTSIPPEQNHHDGTASPGAYTIDLYMSELAVLARYGRTGVKVIATEGGYLGGTQDRRADQMMRAFRDYYSKWPEVLAICPWQLCNPFTFEEGVDWVYRDSTGTYPSHTAKVYEWVYNLAKPWMTTGCISGKVKESQFGAPLAGVTVTLNPGGVVKTTDTEGNYMFPLLAPGTYSVSASKTNYAAGYKTGIGLSAAENEVADFTLTATSSSIIRGTVRDSISGEPLPGVMINVIPGGYSTTTADDGTYIFTGLSPSNYTVTASKYGFYNYTSEPVQVDAGQTRILNWWMGPGQPPSGTSLLGASDFEAPTGGGPASGWISIDGQPHPEIFTIDPNVRFSGISSQKMTPNGSGVNQMWRMSNYNAVSSGNTYRVELWCKTENPSGTVRAKANFYTNDIVYVGSFTCEPQITTTAGWTRLVGYGTMPNLNGTPVTGRMQVELFAVVSSGSVWFDQLWAGYNPTGESPVASPMNTSATANPATGTISVSFRHGVTTGTTGTMVVYRTDRYPLTAADGTLLTDKAGSPGNWDTVYHTGAAWGVRYYYSVFSHRAGGASVSRPCFTSAVLVDTTGPTAPTNVTDEGVYTFSPDTLSCAWSPASDPQSGVTEYRYCIGTSPGSSDLLDWTSTGMATNVLRSGLNLVSGRTYYFTVQAKNGSGIWGSSAYSDGITAGKECASIADARGEPDGSVVKVTGVTASTGSTDFINRFYIIEPDRLAGIQVYTGAPPAVNRGDVLSVAGRLATVNGERVLTSPEITP